MFRLTLVALMLVAAIAAGCGDDDSDDGGGGAGASTTEDAMTEKSGDAMKDEDGDAMEEDDAMKDDRMKDDDAMKGDDAMKDDRMKDDGDAMKEDDAMKDDRMKDTEGAALQEGGAATATAAARRRGRGRRRGRRIRVVRSEYGRVVADGKGEALYLFDRERGSKSRCYGDCAVAWPPLLTKGKPRAGKGAKAGKLGTTRRRGGRLQVTYGGHPLYYYKDDSPGTILCQNVDEFGGLWLVVKPSGKPVRGR